MSGAVRLRLGSPPFLVKPVFLDRLFLHMSGAVRLGLGSPPFLVKPVFLDRLFFIYERRSSATASGRRLFFRNPSLKNEGFFVFHMSGAVRLGLGSPPFLVKPVFLDRLF